MSDANGGGGSSPRHAALEAQADVVRARLVEAIKTLKEKKRRILDPVGAATRHPEAALVAVAGGALVLGAGVALAVHRVATRKERKSKRRRDAWAALFAHPERIRSGPSFGARMLEHTLTAALTALVSLGVKHYGEKLLATHVDPPSPRRAIRVADPFPSPPVPLPHEGTGSPSTEK